MLLTRRGYDDNIVAGKRYGEEEMEQWKSLGNKKMRQAYSQVQVLSSWSANKSRPVHPRGAINKVEVFRGCQGNPTAAHL